MFRRAMLIASLVSGTALSGMEELRYESRTGHTVFRGQCNLTLNDGTLTIRHFSEGFGFAAGRLEPSTTPAILVLRIRVGKASYLLDMEGLMERETIRFDLGSDSVQATLEPIPTHGIDYKFDKAEITGSPSATARSIPPQAMIHLPEDHPSKESILLLDKKQVKSVTNALDKAIFHYEPRHVYRGGGRFEFFLEGSSVHVRHFTKQMASFFVEGILDPAPAELAFTVILGKRKFSIDPNLLTEYSELEINLGTVPDQVAITIESEESSQYQFSYEMLTIRNTALDTLSCENAFKAEDVDAA